MTMPRQESRDRAITDRLRMEQGRLLPDFHQAETEGVKYERPRARGAGVHTRSRVA